MHRTREEIRYWFDWLTLSLHLESGRPVAGLLIVAGQCSWLLFNAFFISSRSILSTAPVSLAPRAPVTITFSANSRTFAANAHCGGVNKCTFADGHQTPFRQTLWGGHGLRMPNTIEPNDADALAGYTRNRNQRGIENSKQQWKWSRVKQNAEHVMLCAIWMTQEYIHKSQRACKTHFRIILIHIVAHTASNADLSSKSRERFACVAVVRCINLSVFSRPGSGRLKSWTRQHNVSLVHFHKFPFIRFCCQLSLICPLFSVSVYLTEKKINVFMFVSST